MWVDAIHSLKAIKRNLNQKQKDYLSNVCAVSGGAIIYTIWQGIFPFSENITPANLIQDFIMSILGMLMIFAGMLIQSNNTRERKP